MRDFTFAESFFMTFFRSPNEVSFYPCEDSQITLRIKFCLSKVLILTVIIKRPTSLRERSYLRDTLFWHAKTRSLSLSLFPPPDRSFNPYPPVSPSYSTEFAHRRDRRHMLSLRKTIRSLVSLRLLFDHW